MFIVYKHTDACARMCVHVCFLGSGSLGHSRIFGQSFGGRRTGVEVARSYRLV